MPLFMDFHKPGTSSAENTKKSPLPDSTVQQKYGVVYRQYWVNEATGAVFCLMEGPDKESCEALHKEAHGNTACSIMEVHAGFNDTDFAQINRANVSTGAEDLSLNVEHRHLLVLSTAGMRKSIMSRYPQDFFTLQAFRKGIHECIAMFQGKEVEWLFDDSIVAVFKDATRAVECAVRILKSQEEIHGNISDFHISVTSEYRQSGDNSFFLDPVTFAQRFSLISPRGKILISSVTKKFCRKEFLSENATIIKVVADSDERFVMALLSSINANLADDTFTVDLLSHDVGISRPQLYRKTMSVTGKAPNDLIRDLRLHRALSLLQQGSFNISEVAFEVGYNNPSYFSKCFYQKFGCTPSDFLEVVAIELN
jgi:AraC-like DNA-binding protein